MRLSGKFVGVPSALAVGSLLFLAPGLVTGVPSASVSLPVDIAQAEPGQAAIAPIKRIDDADRAYIETAIDIEHFGETPGRLARLKAADDAYFETVMAMEAASENARQYARIEAADDAYFETAMNIEYFGETPGRLARLRSAGRAYADAVSTLKSTARTMTRLAELKAEERRRPETVLASVGADDITTGSLPRDMAAAVAAGPMTARLDRIGQADNPDFDAALPVGTLQADEKKIAGIKLAAVDDARPDETPLERRAEIRQPAPSGHAAAAKHRTRHPAQPRQEMAKRPFEERGPVARLFRIFVKGIGFIPSRF